MLAQSVSLDAKELQAHGGAVFAKSCDVSDLEALSEFLGEANKALGGVDILVNNPSGFGLTDDEAGWNAGWSVDMMASVRAVWQVTPWMEARGGGAIINNSSIAAIRDNQGDLIYSAIKAALTHYTRLASVRLGPENIRVNCISPGAIATPIFWGGSARANTLSAEENDQKMAKLQANLAKATPLTRSGIAHDIAQGALYLASDAGRFVNGHDLVIDGGRINMFNES